jgi:phosphate starvation-inducible PhoH-like protein
MPSQLKILVPGDTHVVDLVGQRDELLKVIEDAFASDILVRGNEITITGERDEAEKVAVVFEELLTLLQKGNVLTSDSVGRAVQMVKADGNNKPSEVMGDPLIVTRGRAIRAKTTGQKRYVDAIRDNTLVFAVGPAGTGKCVAGDTLVLTADGMVRIEDLAGDGKAGTYEPTSVTVHGVDGPERASHVYHGGDCETLRISTRLGYTIEVTPEHPLLVRDAGGQVGWSRADALRPGDVLALQRGQQLFGRSVALTHGDAYALGVAAADGGSTGSGQHIPLAVLGAPRAIVSAFLRGLFGAGGSGGRDVELRSASERLLREVQVALLNFGIVSSRPPLARLLTIAGSDAQRLRQEIGGRPSRPKPGIPAALLEECGAVGPGLTRLRHAVRRGLLFLEVESVTPSRARVFDLTVPGSHSFVANGFVNHNTYLAVAMAVHALREKQISRIILTRPAVEAGERLGFLPGDIAQKVDPYLKPLYDALYEMLEPDHFARLTERGTIEVAPLAYMRGRAQPYFSNVLTPEGFRPIGSLQVGDLVVGSDGRPTTVLGVYPQGRKEIFRLRTQDGASTLCCGEHLWSVLTHADKRRRKPPRILETREMKGRLRSFHTHRFELPLVTAPVCFEACPVPIEPYAIGLLLGDGCVTGSSTPSFATADAELAVALEAALDGIELVRTDRYDSVLRHTLGGRGGVIVSNPVTAVLRELGLCGCRSSTKFIPKPYLLNSPDVRLAVLQGLLDTDGGPVTQVGRPCRIQYTTTSAQLRDDVVFLVRSLGGVAYWRTCHAAGRKPGLVNERKVAYRNDAYVMDIRLPAGMRPFRLQRKRQAFEAHSGGRPMRFVHSIEPEGECETICIRVAAPDSLYVTDEFIVTHNTLNDSFIILDEAQNTTPEQMKMFLTRLGLRSKAVVTGDVTQIDLPEGQMSGLIVVEQILQGIDGLQFVHLDAFDVVRHKIVQQIVEAYRRFDDSRKATSGRPTVHERTSG